MHLDDGVLSIKVLAVGGAAAACGVGVGLAQMSERDVPRVAVLSSAFFALSLVHIPSPVMHIHLVLCGLMGLLLGWATFPAVAIALLLQAALFQHGGWSTLGVNTVSMAVPGVVFAWICRPLLRPHRPICLSVGGFLVGFGSVLLAGLIAAIAVFASGRGLVLFGSSVLLANSLLAVVEGVLTMSIVTFLARVRPTLFEVPTARVRSEIVHA